MYEKVIIIQGEMLEQNSNPCEKGLAHSKYNQNNALHFLLIITNVIPYR